MHAIRPNAHFDTPDSVGSVTDRHTIRMMAHAMKVIGALAGDVRQLDMEGDLRTSYPPFQHS
jgi:hypothetical protein